MNKITKKITLAIATIGLAAMSFGYTKEEVKAIFEEVKVLAPTNMTRAQYVANRILVELHRPQFVAVNGDLVKEIDVTFSSLGILGNAKEAFSTSKMTIDMAAFEASDLSTKVPYLVSIAKKYELFIDVKPCSEKADIDELIGILNEQIKNKTYRNSEYNKVKYEIQKRSVKQVKKYLRSQGKSFVTKNGVNPCSDLMQELNTALNAPLFNGLNDFFLKIGLTCKIDTTILPTADEIAKLREDCLFGEKDLTNGNKDLLIFGLGVNGYNQFVKEYNGEE